MFLLDYCQVGLAVTFIIGEISFFCVGMKKAQDLFRALGFGWVQPSELYMPEIAVDSGLRCRAASQIRERRYGMGLPELSLLTFSGFLPNPSGRRHPLDCSVLASVLALTWRLLSMSWTETFLSSW